VSLPRQTCQCLIEEVDAGLAEGILITVEPLPSPAEHPAG
jgi:hypothetical protein